MQDVQPKFIRIKSSRYKPKFKIALKEQKI